MKIRAKRQPTLREDTGHAQLDHPPAHAFSTGECTLSQSAVSGSAQCDRGRFSVSRVVSGQERNPALCFNCFKQHKNQYIGLRIPYAMDFTWVTSDSDLDFFQT